MIVPLSTLQEVSSPAPSATGQVEGTGGQALPPSRRWFSIALGVVGVALIGGAVVVWREPLMSAMSAPEASVSVQPVDPVAVVEPGLLSVAADSRLMRRLTLEPVVRQELTHPLLNATGYVLARLAPGKDHAESRWDFASPEVATAYGDWLNVRADADFLARQTKKTRELVKIKVDFLHGEFKRKEANVSAIPLRDLIAAKADWLQADLQAQKDITEAETGLKKATRNRGLLERQLLQAGVDPEFVHKAGEGLVLVVADVPEARINQVKVGQWCEASFFGVPNQTFKGRVGRLGPAVAKEKRTLRVTFELSDPSARLLPGMFADIGLGTESRSLLTVPTTAIIHSGGSDYVLKEESPGRFRVMEVKVDEPRQLVRNGVSISAIPIRESQLHEGDTVVGAGAILLKPILVKSLTR